MLKRIERDVNAVKPLYNLLYKVIHKTPVLEVDDKVQDILDKADEISNILSDPLNGVTTSFFYDITYLAVRRKATFEELVQVFYSLNVILVDKPIREVK